jgi:hypothetical protein
LAGTDHQNLGSFGVHIRQVFDSDRGLNHERLTAVNRNRSDRRFVARTFPEVDECSVRQQRAALILKVACQLIAALGLRLRRGAQQPIEETSGGKKSYKSKAKHG